jgi:hypothetical protein
VYRSYLRAKNGDKLAAYTASETLVINAARSRRAAGTYFGGRELPFDKTALPAFAEKAYETRKLH